MLYSRPRIQECKILLQGVDENLALDYIKGQLSEAIVGKKMKNDSENIGALIKSYREKSNMTQKTLSELLGYENPQFVSLIENGHSKVPLNVVGRIIDILKIPEKKVVDILVSAYQKAIMNEISQSSRRLSS